MAMKRVDSLNVMKNEPAEEYCLGFPGASAWECSHEEKTGGQHHIPIFPREWILRSSTRRMEHGY
jgi:hypothetical protein